MTEFKRMRPLLGTFVEIGVGHQSKEAEEAVHAAFKQIELIQSLLSFHVENSELTKVNEANGQAVSVHRHTLRVIKLAKAMTIASHGLFNCLVGGEMVNRKVLPNHSQHQTLAYGDADHIIIDRDQVRLTSPVKITLDGIAKGYAVDCAIAALKQHGMASGWVNAGGDLRVFGNKVLSVQRRELDGEHIVLGGVQDAAMATSVVAQIYDPALPGEVVSPIATPKKGVWTVLAQFAWRADALTKVACLADVKERDDLVAALGGVIVYPTSSYVA